ncbi:MAG TPA: YigZ family protein, partial [Desulfomicrobiaceae bacterium]|nr:YigZ family protein [Desulfomicrobiaceae bacterium]
TEFPDATHNCWAFQAGPANDSAFVGMSDDGEPHGTAGKPMLNVLLHSGIGEIAVVVTRYFGGIKLGTGGLVRAYSGMVSLGLETLPTREKIDPVTLEVVIEYGAVTLFKRMLSEHEVEVLAENFGADAVFTIRMPRELRDDFETALMEMTNGTCLVEEQ